MPVVHARSGLVRQGSPPTAVLKSAEAINRTFRAWILLLATAAAPGIAKAGGLISFAAPTDGYIAKDGKYAATLQLTGTANPQTLQVISGSLDITGKFNPSSCSKVPCTLTATLSPGSGVLPGQNYLKARVRGTNGSQDVAQQRFSYRSGVSDPTTGTLPGHLVPIRQVGSAITIMTPTPSTLASCPNPQILVSIYDRTSLEQQSSNCLPAENIDPILANRDKTALIFVKAEWGSGVADFTRMGGNGDKTNKVGYYAIGYGGAPPGLAFEAWQETSDDGSHPKTINGNLVNLGCNSAIPICTQNPSAPFYTFQPTNAMGFAIIPGQAGSPGSPGLPTIYVGNPAAVPIGTGYKPPNQVRPTNSGTGRDLFSYSTYSPQWTGRNAAGGMYLVFLNRSDLTKRSESLYITNCGCDDHTTDNQEIQRLTVDLGDPGPNILYLLTTVGIPFNADSFTGDLVAKVSQIGISGYALQGIIPDHMGNVAKAGFSMVTYAQPDGTNTNRLYSTAANIQQGESGALRGVFSKQKSAYYEAQGVAPFSLSSMPVYATPDDYLAHALSASVGSTEPVAWPQMDTQSKRAAYAYLSNQLVQANLGNKGDCGLNCFDVRYYYTGIDAPNIYKLVTPQQAVYPGDSVAQANGFSAPDYEAVRSQLQTEAVYLSDVVSLQAYTEELNTNSDLNVSSVLRNAGVTITNDLEQTLKIPPTTTGNTPLAIASQIFNTVGAFVSMGRVAASLSPAAALLSGLLETGGNLLADIQSSQKQTDDNLPSPYLTYLEQLTVQDTEKSESAATKFANDQMTAMGVFYNGVYSDWFRLQAVALLSQDQAYGGWFIANKDNGRDDYLHTLSANVRINLYQQILPQYFKKVTYLGAATEFHRFADQTDNNTTFAHFLGSYDDPRPNLSLSNISDYSWDNRTSPGSSVCEDYVLFFTKDTWGTPWPSDFGDMLFGNAPNSDGISGQLNLDRNWVYDLWTIPDWDKYPNKVSDKTVDGLPFGWSCATYGKWPMQGSNVLTPTITLKTQSLTIPPGTDTIFLGGTISAGTHYPLASSPISISIGDTTITTTLNSTGEFDYNFPTKSIPASPTPYTIAYSFPGSPDSSKKNYLLPAVDRSTTLTINSSNTETVLRSNVTQVVYPAAPTLSVNVKSPAGTPTGTVTLFDGATQIGQTTLDTSGNAQFAPQGLTGGTHLLIVNYSGGSGFQPSVSNQIAVVVAPAATSFDSGAITPSSISYGTASVTVSGVFHAGTAYAANGDSVLITIGGASQTAKI